MTDGGIRGGKGLKRIKPITRKPASAARVRWDASPSSLYQKLAQRFPTVVSLVGPGGESRFLDDQGTALVPDTTRQTSQSAKADVYVWALETLLKPAGTLNPTEFGWMLDARWIADPDDYAGNPSATNPPINR